MLSTQVNSNDWLAISQEWEASNLSQPEFCKRKNLSYVEFTEKRGKLIARGLVMPCHKRPKFEDTTQSMRFLPINLEAAPQQLESAAAPKFIEIQLPHGIVMRIPTC